jgi:hypothetical protein
MMAMASNTPAAKARGLGIKLVLIMAANAIGIAVLNGAIGALTGADMFHGGGGGSQAAAMFVGLIHVSFGLTAAGIRATARFEPDPEHAEDVRREGRALLLGAVALVAAGTSLVVLGLAGPGMPIAPVPAAVVAQALNAFATILAAVRMRRLDELNRQMNRDAGYGAFFFTSLIGGTWSVLAHVGLVRALAPLDWLSLMAGIGFVAGIVVLVRRGGFGQP